MVLYSATNPQPFKARIDYGYELGEDEAAFGLGDGPAKLGGGFNPFLDDDFDVGEGFAEIGRASCRERVFITV